MGIIEDLQAQLKERQERLEPIVEADKSYRQIQANVKEAVSYKMKEPHVPGLVKDALEYLSWLDSVEADTIPAIGGIIQQNRWRLRFTQPTISEQTQPSIPVEVMKDVKGNLTVLAMSYVLTDDATQEKEVLVKEIRDIAVAIQSLRYGKEAAESGKESADLTRTNIKVAIWVPVVVLVATLLLSIIYDTYKVEVDSGIRLVLGQLGGWMRLLFTRGP